jgi:hypothetical protein
MHGLRNHGDSRATLRATVTPRATSTGSCGPSPTSHVTAGWSPVDRHG